MKYRSTFRVAVIAAALIVTMAAAARAQVCGAPNLTVNNLTGCTVNLCLKAMPAIFPWCFAVPPSPPPTSIPLPPGTNIAGIAGMANISYPFVANPAIFPPLWVPNVTLAFGCCCDVFYDPPTCTMWVRPTASFPPCRP